MDLKQQTIDTYNATARAMAEKFSGLGARVEDIDRGFLYCEKENPFVLEIGCGNGRDSVEILKHTDSYLGIDISESMIRLARETAPQGKFEVVDVESYAFPSGIDIVFSFASLLHSDRSNIARIFERFAEAMNTEGIFYLSLKYGEGRHTKTDEFGTRTYYFYVPEDIKEIVQDHFEVVYEDVHDLREQKWFVLILKKKKHIK